ncbi:MAG: hypothetical protein QOF16_1687, partial [Actinomycetota bacterium]|nr:hypothetical protein [Actinomycetota bacterium]
MISSTSDAPLAQVGGLVGYTVTISNEGSSVLRDVSAVDRVPIELDVVSAAINSNVQATELGQTGRKEDIVWQVGPMTPGEVLHLRWTGKVVGLGGFDAVNDVRARSRSVVAATTSTTYLASTRVIGATNPAYHSTRTVVTYAAATSSQTGAAAAAAAASDATEQLPFTG